MTAIARDLRAALSPVAFAQDKLGITPDQWQERVLTSSVRQVALCCSRQAGKSTVSSILALHTALYQPGSLVVLISPSLRQSGELFRKVTGYLKLIPGVKLDQDSATSVTIKDGGRIVSLPGNENTIRGFSSVTLAVFDEAGFADDGTYRALRPMLAVSQGRLVLLSTPNGKRGFFWDAWNDGGTDWQRVSVPATECPRIKPEFLESEKKALGMHWFRQEYLCEFVESTEGLLDYDTVMNAFSSDVKPLDLNALLGDA
jgi:Terminase large subunit, T4likevirus-type, N-terminal